MLVTQNSQLQRKFIGSDELVAGAVEKARQVGAGPWATIVNILMTALVLGATGCFVRVIVLIMG